MKDSTVLNNNPILKEIKNKYGEIRIKNHTYVYIKTLFQLMYIYNI